MPDLTLNPSSANSESIAPTNITIVPIICNVVIYSPSSKAANITADKGSRYPNIVFQTWGDHAVMSMVESGLDISILPNLILKRIPYGIKAIPLNPPAYRDICIAKRKGKDLSLAAENFLEFVKFRNDHNSK